MPASWAIVVREAGMYTVLFLYPSGKDYFCFICCVSPSVPREVCNARGLRLLLAGLRRCCGCLCLRVPVGEGGGCRKRRPNSQNIADVTLLNPRSTRCAARSPHAFPIPCSARPCAAFLLLPFAALCPAPSPFSSLMYHASLCFYFSNKSHFQAASQPRELCW